MALTREHLRDYLLNADERAVYHAYPRQIADSIHTDHRTMLDLLAESMLLGDVALHWDIECPACKMQDHFADSLETVPEGDVTCKACGNVFGPHLDEDVLVTFSVHPALRRLSGAAADPDYRAEIVRNFEPTTGHELLTQQTFRDWAQNQPLPPGQSLEVRRVGLLFTDLSGSTALYARRGDPRAYHLVRDHYDVLTGAINENGGSVVKTIGDGIMAAFTDGLHALKAALDGHIRLADFNERNNLPPDDCLVLKAGIHAGPTIMVTLNDRLDYFGQTVNLASRIEGISLPGNVTISQPVFDEPGVEELLTNYPVEAAKVAIKGFDEPVIVNRFQVLGEDK
ncbi:MAG: hypothetical protein JXJ17_01300 [Anaerolineae bacterium]|nr:hypothetical protein [Anaerolineae bacterium]